MVKDSYHFYQRQNDKNLTAVPMILKNTSNSGEEISGGSAIGQQIFLLD